MPRGSNIVDLTGKTFGRWTVLGYSHNTGRATYWSCRCECGNERLVVSPSLRNGRSTSCGCFRRENTSRHSTRHGHSRTLIYGAWRNMISRCHRETADEYPRYGARGIKVCDRWRMSFQNFLADMGERPTPQHSVERIDNDGDYCPENCRWATMAEQGQNRRNSQLVTFDGVTKTVSAWAREAGIGRNTLRYRLDQGWPVEDAIHRPANWKHFRPGTRKRRSAG